MTLHSHAAPPLRLAVGTLETDRTEQRDAYRALRSTAKSALQQRLSMRGTAPWLIQFEGPIQADWKRAIEQSGARIAGYVPDHALLVEATPKALRAIIEHPHVVWAGEYQPAYKRAREVRVWLARRDEPAQECEVVLFRPEDVAAVAREIMSQPDTTVLLATNLTDRGLIRLRAATPVLETISRWSEVEWIGPYIPPAFLNNVAVQTNFMNVVPAWTVNGLTGSGQVIAVCDTGLDTGQTNTLHPDFAGRLAWIQNVGRPDRWDDPEGHGTHVAGSVLSSGAASTGLYRGVAYDARLVLQSALGPYGGVNVPADLNNLFRAAFTNGARIHSNSWGAGRDGEYTLDCRNLDLFVWEHPTMLVLFAAGNEGVDANEDGVVDLDGIGSPAAAKNGLTVGAAESLRSTNITYGTRHPYDYPVEPLFSDLIAGPGNVPQGMAAFSSRGPCDDGRIKPDLVAPGTYIISTRSTLNPDAVDTPPGNTNYMFASGTSMATPLTAGAAGLARQWISTRYGIAEPSAALIKALLVCGSRNMAPGQYGTGTTQEIPDARPNAVQGWGHVNLARSVNAPPGGFLHLYDSFRLATGETNRFLLTVGAATTNRFTLTLAYSDYVASLGSGIQLVNDLDLSVRTPSGTILYPNDLGAPDSLNNVEFLEFAPGEAGTYAVEIAAPNVPMGGRQPYALVIRGYDTGPQDTLVIRPTGPFVTVGPEGGPFTPIQMAYALSNAGPTAASWSAEKDPILDWLSISETNGVLPAESATNVILLVQPSANSLASGIYAGMVSFTNHTSGDIQYRPVSLLVRPATRFLWGTLSSPQHTGTQFSATLTAVDERGDVVTSYSGPAAVSAAVLGTNTIGTGTNAWGWPITSYYDDSRTQSIYLQSELGGAALLDGLSIHVQSLPSMMLGNWTIRMKHTAWSNHPQVAWEGPTSGWTTVFSQDFTLPHTGWVNFAFSTPFAYDGTNNLLIDFSKNNHTYDGWAFYGYLSASTCQPERTAFEVAGSYFGDPLLWSGTNYPNPSLTNLVPNIRLAYRTPVPVEPTQTGPFTNGQWSGGMVLPAPVEQVVLRAEDGARRGDSDPLNVEGSPPAAPVTPWASATNMTTFTAAWAGVAGATSYRFDVGAPPDLAALQPGYSNLLVTATSCTVTGLSNETAYAFRVRAYAGPTPGPYSPTAVVTTRPFTAPPQFVSIQPLIVTAGVMTAFTVAATGAPAPSLKLLNTTAGSGYQFQPASGLLSYKPPYTDGGLRLFTFQASNEVATATQVVEVTVLSPLIAYEGFDITPGAGALSGASGATSTGWTNTWTAGVANHVVAQGLGFTNGGTLVTVGGAAQLALSGSGGGSFRSLSPAYGTSTGIVWVSFIARVTNSSSYCGLSLVNPNNEMLFIGDPSGATTWGAQAFGTGGMVATSSIPVSSQAFIVVRVDFNASGNLDDSRVWINPSLTEAPPADAAATLNLLGVDLSGSGSAARFNRVRLQQGTAGANGVFDEIRIGTTWGAVAPALASSSDVDGDGLPNDWETTYFGSETGGNPSALASNGVNTVLECYIADLNPNATGSLFVVTSATLAPGGGLVASFTASTGRYYQLLYATNGPAAGWSVSNLGWGIPNMKVTNQVGAVWLGGVQVRLDPPVP